MKSLLKQLWYIRSLRVRKKGGLSQFNVKNAIFRGKMKIRNITATNGWEPPPPSISTSMKILYHRTSIKVSLTSVVKNHTHFRIYSHENLSYYILESYLFNEIALQNKLVNFEFLTYIPQCSKIEITKEFFKIICFV